MSATLAILTIGIVPLREVMALLTEHISEQQITHISLLGKMTRDDVMESYAPTAGEAVILALLSDNQPVEISRAKVERDLQAVVEVLDNQSYDVILLMSTAPIKGLVTRNAIMIEPQRIIPPLVSSIVEGHRVGVIVPVPELLTLQRDKWNELASPPVYALANPVHGTEEDLIAAGESLLEKGADVLMLDCPGYHQRHRDVLQKKLDVPVLLSNALVARLAAELLG